MTSRARPAPATTRPGTTGHGLPFTPTCAAASGHPGDAGHHQHRAAGQDPPAVPLRQRHRDRRADEAAHAERDRGQPGLQRREVLAGLQPQREREEEALHAGGEGELNAHPGRERRDPEQPGRSSGAAPSPGAPRRAPGPALPQQPTRPGHARPPAAATPRPASPADGPQAAGRRWRPASRPAAPRRARSAAGRPGPWSPARYRMPGDQRAHGHRHVHEEHRAPAPAEQVRVGQHAAEQQPDRGREAEHRPVDAERLAPLRPARRWPGTWPAPAAPWRPPRCPARPGRRSARRRSRTARRPGWPARTSATPNRNTRLRPNRSPRFPAMISAAANASMYAGHHPLQLGGAGVQVTADGRQRHVDDRHVDHVHQRPDDHDDRGEPAAGVTGLGPVACPAAA